MNESAITEIYVVYPQGWFQGRGRGGSGRAKRHAVTLDPASLYRGQMVYAFCGVRGEVGPEFKDTEPNAITCSRCVKAANKARGTR